MSERRTVAAVLASIIRRMDGMDTRSEVYIELESLLEEFNTIEAYNRRDPVMDMARQMASAGGIGAGKSWHSETKQAASSK